MFIERDRTGSKHQRIKWHPDRALACLMWSEVYKMELESIRHRVKFSDSGEPCSRLMPPDLQKRFEPFGADEVLEWLAGRIDEEVITMEAYGGVEAARVAYGKFGKVAFAGEVPPMPDQPAGSSYPNFPA